MNDINVVGSHSSALYFNLHYEYSQNFIELFRLQASSIFLFLFRS